MDLFFIVVMLFYGVIIEAREFLRIGRDDSSRIPEDSKEGQSQPLALIILEVNENSESNEPYDLQYIETNSLPATSNSYSAKPNDIDTDSSGDQSSDEYADSDTSADTDSESNYYHEEDYNKELSDKEDLSDVNEDKTAVLRKRWRSCQKSAAKVCRRACSASYKNACDMNSCDKKLRRSMKKECKRNCKDFFE